MSSESISTIEALKKWYMEDKTKNKFDKYHIKNFKENLDIKSKIVIISLFLIEITSIILFFFEFGYHYYALPYLGIIESDFVNVKGLLLTRIAVILSIIGLFLFIFFMLRYGNVLEFDARIFVYLFLIIFGLVSILIIPMSLEEQQEFNKSVDTILRLPYFFETQPETKEYILYEIYKLLEPKLLASDFGNTILIAVISVVSAVYIGHWRIIGAGEAHYFAIMLILDIENIERRHKGEKVKKYFLRSGKNLIDDIKKFMKGIDDWCSEEIHGRIYNLNEFTRLTITEISKNFEEFKTKIKNLFNNEFFNQLKEHRDIMDLSKALKDIEDNLKFKLVVDKDTLMKKIQRNLGKTGVISTLIGAIGPISKLLGF
ncbi:MAG: hypothetical protein ACFFCM_11380 [Promethearchaeota archaeon]